MSKYLIDLGKNARKAFVSSSAITDDVCNLVLHSYAELLQQNKTKILKANVIDLAVATDLQQSPSNIDRLKLDDTRIEQIIDAVQQISKFASPINKIQQSWQQPNKLQFARVTIPIGVLAVIFESRPNVASDIASLALKSGNTVILARRQRGNQYQ